MITEIIRLAMGLIVALVTALYSFIKSKLSAKMRTKVEEIAAIIESIYNGCTSTEKLEAFKDVCNAKKIDVDKAVKYLEEHIIPLSKKINRYELITTVKTDDEEVTN